MITYCVWTFELEHKQNILGFVLAALNDNLLRHAGNLNSGVLDMVEFNI